MSIVALLVDFPNYSARKVRRLAQQLAYLTGGTALQKGIAEDLMEFNLLKAKTEAQLNDDISEAAPQKVPVKLDDERVTERICVVSVKEARRALEKMIAFANANSDVRLSENFEELTKSCHGIINGSSFYTDRVYIQARTSPQDDLPLEKSNEVRHPDNGPAGPE
jgi:hypothetical protein